MNKEILTLLQEKLNKSFEGTTGIELKKYLEENGDALLTQFIDQSCLMVEEFSAPDKYYLSMEAKSAKLLDEGFHYEEVVSKDDEVYYSVAEMIAAGDEVPMIYGYLTNINENFGFFQMVDRVHSICKEHKVKALLEFENPYGDNDLTVKFDAENIQYDGVINIIDDSADELLQSFMWIAYRLNDGDIDKFLSLFEINIEKKEVSSDLSKRLLRIRVFENKEDIIDQLTKTPKSILNYLSNTNVILDEDVLITFINANEKHMLSLVEDAHYNDGFKIFHQYFYKTKANDYLNGMLEIPEVLKKLAFNSNFLLEHPRVLQELSKKILVKDIIILENDLEKIESMLKNYPALIIPIVNYYNYLFVTSETSREKFLKANKLLDDASNYELAIRKAIQLARKYNIESLNYLLSKKFEYYDLAIELCDDLPSDIKREIVLKNYYLMQYFKNDFSFDDPLVIKIVGECPISYLLVNDETIIRYKLKQTRNMNCVHCENKCNKIAF